MIHIPNLPDDLFIHSPSVCADVCIGYWWKARGVDNIKVDLVEI
jgi:hypothetical protein